MWNWYDTKDFVFTGTIRDYFNWRYRDDPNTSRIYAYSQGLICRYEHNNQEVNFLCEGAD